ncbi:MAG: aminotransferase class IV [Rubrobacteraceae bacterium]
MSLAYLNGSYLPAGEAKVSAWDRGLSYGDGVFTTIGVSGGDPRFLAWHLERLGRDAAAIHIEPPELESLAEACRGLIPRLELESGVLKIIVTRGPGGRGPSVLNTGDPTVLVTASEAPAARPPLRAITIPDSRGPLAAHKTLNYLPNVLGLREAEAAGCDEALFAEDGTLLEGTVSNVVGFHAGGLLTPALDGKTLPGVARRAVLEAGLVREGTLPETLDGPLYCVNSVRGIEAVSELDGRKLYRDPEIQGALEEAFEDQAQKQNQPRAETGSNGGPAG